MVLLSKSTAANRRHASPVARSTIRMASRPAHHCTGAAHQWSGYGSPADHFIFDNPTIHRQGWIY